MSKVHNFAASLLEGQKGEEMFAAAFTNLERTDGRKHDFICRLTNQSYELKTDSYSMEGTGNFFIELYSIFGTQMKSGGPTQAFENNTDYWCYFYVKNHTAFIFNTWALNAWLGKNAANYTEIKVKNDTWTTYGILVWRDDLAHLYKEVEL